VEIDKFLFINPTVNFIRNETNSPSKPQTISLTNRLIPFDQIMTIFEDLKVCYQSHKSI